MSSFYPSFRTITAITKASRAVITTSVPSGYNIGDVIRIDVPDTYKMVEINGMKGRVTAVSGVKTTVDIDSSGFTAFAWPSDVDTDNFPLPRARTIPIGVTTMRPNNTSDLTCKD